jgi:hyperosmotically inducible periplasmic protein
MQSELAHPLRSSNGKTVLETRNVLTRQSLEGERKSQMRHDLQDLYDIIPNEERSRRSGFIWGLVTGAAIGAAAMFILDPQNGRRRRSLARDKAIKARNTVDHVVNESLPRRADYASGVAEGARHRIQEFTEGTSKRPAENEQVLLDRVLSTVFRDPELPKGDLNINATGSTVFLRGSIEDQEIVDTIEKRVRDVEGVDNVVNLINQPDADPDEVRAEQ